LNKWIGTVRLTRDPEIKSFGNGGKVAKLGLVVNERKKTQSGQWEDKPIWLDGEAYNKGDYGKLADTVEKYCKKGDQIAVEAHLSMDEWDDKQSGQKRTKLKLVIDAVHLLGKSEGTNSSGGQSRPQQSQSRQEPAFAGGPSSGDGGDSVPF
jgi:single-strand DNA-binding protein